MLTLFLACAWAASEYYEFFWVDKTGAYGVSVERGTFQILRFYEGSLPGLYLGPVRYWSDSHEWMPGIWTLITLHAPDSHRGTRVVNLPLWLPFLFVALPTARLFYLDRRRIPPNHCRTCGYNLTGNVSGVCPECGQGIA